MEVDEIKDRLVIYFAQQGKVAQPDEDLFEADVIDSMGVMDMVLFIEEELGVELNQSRMKADNFRTIERVAATIKSAQN